MSGGGKGKAKTPTAPDYTALANQQAKLNMEAAEAQTMANRPNQYDAFGNSITWERQASPELAGLQQQMNDLLAIADEDVNKKGYSQAKATAAFNKRMALQKQIDAAKDGTWVQRQNLNPETKAAWEKQQSDANSALSRYGDLLNNYMKNYQAYSPNADFSAGQVKAYNDPEFSGDSVAEALYRSVMDRGRVEQQRESDSLTSQLRNSGLVPGSEAYNRAMQNLMTSQNDANLLASQNATLAGANEGRAKYASYLSGNQQGYNQAANTYGLNSQNYQMNRNQPLQEMAGLAGIAGGTPYSPTYASFSGATGYNPADLMGAAQMQFNASQGAANAQNSKKGGLLGAGASLGGSYLGSK